MARAASETRPAPTGPAAIEAIIAADADQAVPPPILAIALAARARHGEAVAAVLAYGSCLRDGDDVGKIVDLYLLTDGPAERGWLLPRLNRLLPPNVYYLEVPFGERRVRAKYALLDLARFGRLVTPAAFHPYFWARFAQPTALAWARDEESRARALAALAQAPRALFRAARPLLPERTTAPEFWTRAFAETYRTELRAERVGRAHELHATHAERYDRLYQCLAGDPDLAPTARRRRRAARAWAGRRALGKLLSVLRLIKAAFTFRDGPDYLLWKIERHSGVRHRLTPWQRRHPLLAAPWVFWRLYRQGAFR